MFGIDLAFSDQSQTVWMDEDEFWMDDEWTTVVDGEFPIVI